MPKDTQVYKKRPEIRSQLNLEASLPVFTDETINYGIFKPHMQSSEVLEGLNESFGPGACTLDYNNDGWMDLFLINGSGQRHYFGAKEWWQSNTPYTLYKNTGLNSFEDVTTEALGNTPDAWGMGCSAADLDNDGDQDLVLSNYGANLLLKNNGDGTFSDSTMSANIMGEDWSTSILTADFNNDGLLDLYILNYIEYKQGLKTYEASTGYSSENSTQFNSSLFDSSSNKLYINQGDLVFKDQTQDAGLNDFSGRGLSAIALDINSDNFPDIYIANGQGSPNKLFLNNKNSSFTDVSENYKISTIKQSTGITAADINNDGRSELFIGTNNKNSKLLYEQNSDGVFEDIAKIANLDKTETSGAMTWGVSFTDLNNDGDPDLFFANGFNKPDLIAPRKSQGQPNTILIKSESGFIPCGQQCINGTTVNESSRSVIPVDIDNDGDKDLYITQNNALGQLLVNKTKSNNWLGISLIGTTSNRDALGAVLTLKTNNKSISRSIDNSSFLSSRDTRLSFHIGDDSLESLSIQWPDGKKQIYTGLPINRYISITEGSESFSNTLHTAQAIPESKIIFSSPTRKIEVIGWLNIHNLSNTANSEIRLILNNKPSLEELKLSLKSAEFLDNETALKIYLLALKSNNTDLRIDAIKKLKVLESEISSRYLLSLFKDPSAIVRCEIAKTYEHFFREEEAMIHSKNLAITHLIHALTDTSEEVKICAINALTESENHRAAQPLMQLISDIEQSETVKNNAIHALGLLREKKSTAFLLKIVHDSKQSPESRYLSIGALKRLNAFDERSFFTGNLNKYYKSRTEFTGFLNVLDGLSINPDLNVIIDINALKNILSTFKKENLATLNASEIGLINNLLNSKPQFQDSLKKTSINDKDKKLQFTLEQIKEMQTLLTDLTLDTETRAAILNNPQIKRLFSTQKIAKSIASNNNDPLSDKALVFLIEKATDKDLVSYKNQLLDNSIPESQRFLIAKGLYTNHPEYVIQNVLK